MKERLTLICAALSAMTLIALACSSPATQSVPSTTSVAPKPLVTTAPAAGGGLTTTYTPLASPTQKQWDKAPAMQIDTAKKYAAIFDTDMGTFKIQLFPLESPRTVNSFVFLSKQGFFNGVIFHRIIKDFMIQGGDPTGTGGGSPGYKFEDELPPRHKYDPGIVAMANSGPNTNGSQFFICTGQQAHGLDSLPNYTQFGQVSDGMDVVQKIAAVPVEPTGERSKPVKPPVIKGITITESP